ncbi:unnamed protein product (macronuclear) [Paramecium tetraurelia]|uniref:Uncharacterized protein n=1 Tax=Paramecium tetraurelia TaxID=5888 RepID=A0CTI9_PARTE|nr:uncharacterized protein GSPATT00010340001 [Paramecium tetraurelia]CAK74106.1 unnamed protein product [Paramecium tetraurelia]|eukprot:XP_001441503.1 hypothetical protein (macronuclear) [Paramecium tetraurelia strain d4-2]
MKKITQNGIAHKRYYLLMIQATVQQFIKSTTNGEMKCSNEFVTQVMSLARDQYYLSGKWKKTISGEFFYKAIVKLRLDGQIPFLSEMEEEIKEEVNLKFSCDYKVKNQNKARFQDEEHLKQLEEQQKELYEKAKLVNSKLIFEEEDNSKPKKALNLQFNQEQEDLQ